MNQEQAVAFLQALGAKKIKQSGHWLVCSCLLAKWLHERHVDMSPSFGLSIEPGVRSYFNCFTCMKGSAEVLLQTLELYAKGDYQKYDFKLAHELLDGEQKILPLPEYVETSKVGKEFIEWPSYWLDSFKQVGYIEIASNYLLSRGVSTELWTKYDLRFDSKRNMIVVPYWNVFGKFAGARGRSILSDVHGSWKHFDYSWQGNNNAGLVWYNEQVLQISGPVVIVEGQFDCWRTVQAYSKTVANLTAKPSWEKMKKLGDCPFVIQIPDRDEGGLKSIPVYAMMCKDLNIGHKVLMLDEGVKDPDECHPDYLKGKIEELL